MDTMIFSRAKRQLLGFAYDADKAGVVWVDEHIARLQQMVDRALPDTLNVVRVAGQNPKRALIRAYSDINPESFYLLDTEKLTIRKLGSSRRGSSLARCPNENSYDTKQAMDSRSLLT